MELFYYYRVLLSVIIALNLVNGQNRLAYRIPQPTAAVLTPRGFRISIPDERGIVLFAFHGSINKEIRANEEGDFHGQTRTKSNGQWSFETTRYQLQRGDVLNFWLYVQHDNFGYKLEDLRFVYPDHFVYNTNYGTNDDVANNYGGLNSDETQNLGVTNVDDSHVYNTAGGGQWQQPTNDFVTYRTTRITTSSSTTTTPSPYLVFEDSFNTQPQYQSTRTTRPTARPTRTTARTTRTTPRSSPTSSNYWPGTTTSQRPSQQHGSSSSTGQQQRPSHNSGTATTTNQQRPYNTGITQQSQFTTRPSTINNYDYNDDSQNRQQQQHQTNSQPSQFGGLSTSQFGGVSNTQTQQHRPQQSQKPQQSQSQQPQSIGNQFGELDNDYRPQQHGTSSNGNNNNQHHQQSASNGIPFSQPDTPAFGVNQPTQQTLAQGNSQNQQGNQFGQQGNTQSNRPNQNCRPSITTVNKKRIACKDQLVFEEQFDYNFESRWTQDVRMPLEFEDAEFVVYENYPSIWNVTYGNLNIFPKLLYQVPESGFSENDIRSGRFVIDNRDCTSMIDPTQECERQAGLKRVLPPIVTAKFRSKKSFSFKYGKVEIRAKVPKGDWLFPQIHLEPSDNKYRGTGDLPFLNGQVRIAFVRGNEYLEKPDGLPLDGKILTGICVINGGDTGRETARKSIHFGQEHFGSEFHTYSMIWTNMSIKFAVDDLEFGTDTGGYKNLPIQYANFWQTGTNMAPFDQEFHIALGVAAGGNADFPDDARTGWTKLQKPWENTSPKAELSFYLHADEWHSTWNNRDSGLVVDYVKVTSV